MRRHEAAGRRSYDGRPTALVFTREELDKQFKRV